MPWTITFYKGVDQEILAMPAGIQARMLRLLELMEKHGANLGPPHTRALGGGLFEIRAKAKEGIGRGLYCYAREVQICVLYSFVKKTQKTPKQVLDISRARMKEVAVNE